MMSQTDPNQPNKTEGLMLHPSVGEHVDEEVRDSGPSHPVRNGRPRRPPARGRGGIPVCQLPISVSPSS